MPLAIMSLITRAVVLAFFGGIVAVLVSFGERPNLPTAQRPDLKDPTVWVVLLAMPFVAALLGYLHDDPAAPLGKLAAFQIGLSTPLILRAGRNLIPVAHKDIGADA
jgi:hypothetical protein